MTDALLMALGIVAAEFVVAVGGAIFLAALVSVGWKLAPSLAWHFVRVLLKPGGPVGPW